MAPSGKIPPPVEPSEEIPTGVWPEGDEAEGNAEEVRETGRPLADKTKGNPRPPRTSLG